ncbi:hypothetical protein T03_5401 [Trichinella britovi]|uniref:Uncharacterized protein n=1 Tax=Trichinella britovi TaxID=45882 RepID=A0A0V1CWU5_TRIBR|nr:hypothetical protein T03_5401 [Trichinella britovi]
MFKSEMCERYFENCRRHGGGRNSREKQLRGRLVLGRDETVVSSVGVQGRQNDANELNAHWLSVGFCILFLSVFSILVLFLVCNILHICGFPSTLSHSTRHFTEVDSLPTLARRLRTSPSSNLQLNRYAKKSCKTGFQYYSFIHYYRTKIQLQFNTQVRLYLKYDYCKIVALDVI